MRTAKFVSPARRFSKVGQSRKPSKKTRAVKVEAVVPDQAAIAEVEIVPTTTTAAAIGIEISEGNTR
jgi:hypothetical protein